MEESDISGPVRRISSLKVRDDRRIERARKANSDSWIRGTERGQFPLSGRGCFWLGSFLTLALVALSLSQVVPRVESRLEQQAFERLAEAGIETGGLDIDFVWRDGEVSGLVALESSLAEIEDVLAGIDGTRQISVSLEVAESPTPTTAPGPATTAGPVSVIAQFQGRTLSLSGTVLSEEQRANLVDSAGLAMGAENVVDRLDVSGLVAEIEGADSRVNALATVLALIEGPASGRIVLVDENLSANLTVSSEQNRADLLSAFEQSELVGERRIDVAVDAPGDSGDSESEESLSVVVQAQALIRSATS